MAYYSRYMIQPGDTLQRIAFIELGTVDKWEDLVTLNNLVYPYIVDTDEERLQDPEHLVTTGDLILLPSYVDDISKLDISGLDSFDKQNIYDTTMGEDLKLTVDSSLADKEGIASLNHDDTTGDVETTKGLDNLVQSITMRLLTRQGSLLYHPDYGTRLDDYIGQKVTSKLIQLIVVEIERTITSDDRVGSCTNTFYKYSDGILYTNFEVEPIGEQEVFDLFIARAENGTISIRNNG